MERPSFNDSTEHASRRAAVCLGVQASALTTRRFHEGDCGSPLDKQASLPNLALPPSL